MELFRPHADSWLALLLRMNFQKQIYMCIKATGDFSSPIDAFINRS